MQDYAAKMQAPALTGDGSGPTRAVPSPRHTHLTQLAADIAGSTHMTAQRTQLENINHGVRLQSAPMYKPMQIAAVQLKRVGYVPAAPGGFRNFTNSAYDGSGNPQGGKAFNGAQTAAVRADNSAAGGGAAPVIGVGAHNRSDVGVGAALMNRDMVSAIEPEVDHIVPVVQGGANDKDNARVISKLQNAPNAGGVTRPNAAQKVIRAHENFDIGPTGGAMLDNIQAGAMLTAVQAGYLARYTGIIALGAPPPAVGAYSGANITTMINAGNGTQNGIDIA